MTLTVLALTSLVVALPASPDDDEHAAADEVAPAPTAPTAPAHSALDAGDDVIPPELLEGAAPPYPSAALGKRTQVDVELELVIDAAGVVTDATIVRVDPADAEAVFSETALSAARGLRFSPARVGGEAVSVAVGYTIRFTPPPTARIAGKVTADGDGVAANIVAVVTVDGSQYAKTTAAQVDGTFLLEELPGGEWVLRFAAPGFQPLEKRVQLPPDSAVVVNAELIASASSGGGEYDVLVQERATHLPSFETLRSSLARSAGAPIASSVTPRIVTRPIGPPPGGGPRSIGPAPGGPPPGGPPPGGPPPGGPPPGGPPPGGPPPGGPGGGPAGPGGRPGPSTTSTALLTTQTLVPVAVPALAQADGMIVRGLHPSGSVFTLDGIQVPGAFHFGQLEGLIAPAVLADAQTFLGDFSGQYGHATSAVVAMKLDDTVGDAFTGHADASLLDSDAAVRVPIAGVADVFARGSYSYVDAIASTLRPLTGTLPVASLPRVWDAQARLLVRPVAPLSLSSFFLVASDANVDVYGDEEQEIAAGTVALQRDVLATITTAKAEIAPSLEIDATFGYTREQWAHPSFDLVVARATGRTSLRLQIFETASLSTGAEYLHELAGGSFASDVDADGEITTTSVPDVGADTASAWIALTLGGARGPRLETSARADYFVPTEHLTGDVGANVSVPFLIDGLELTAYGGTHHRQPSALEMSPVVGDEGLVSSSSAIAHAGARYRRAEMLNLSGRVFLARTFDDVTSPEEGSEKNLSNDGGSTSAGVDVELSHQLLDELDGWAAYTLAAATALDVDTGEFAVSPYDQTHVFAAGLAWHAPWDITISSRFVYATGAPYTPIFGSVYSETQGSFLPIEGEDLSGRMPDYLQLDVRLERPWLLGDVKLTTYAEVRNATAWASPAEELVYSDDYSASAYRVVTPLLPSIGLRAEF